LDALLFVVLLGCVVVVLVLVIATIVHRLSRVGIKHKTTQVAATR
jgi:hypothetical protein